MSEISIERIGNTDRRYYVGTGWRVSRPFAVIDRRSGQVVMDWQYDFEAREAADALNGCAICGQRDPHRTDCPKFGTEGLPVYYGEDDSE